MGKFSKGRGVSIPDPEGMFHSPGKKGVAMEAHKRAMMRTNRETTMDREVDNVAEIVRLFRLLDTYDKCLVRGFLDESVSIEEMKATLENKD